MPNDQHVYLPTPPPAPNALQDAIAQIRGVNDSGQQGVPPDKLKTLMMLLQGADALNTADFLKRPGTFETDPLMKPFARAGNPLPMMGAYGLEDLLMSLLTRHNPKMQHAAEMTQILQNAGGLLKTNTQAARDDRQNPK